MKGIILKDLYENFRIFKNGGFLPRSSSFPLPAYRGYANGRLIFLKIFLYADYCFCVSAFRLLLY